MTKKRWLAGLLALLCVLTIGISAGVLAERNKPMVISLSTRMSGNFFTRQWGDNTADIEVEKLTSGYPTAVFSDQKEVKLNKTVVEEVKDEVGEGKKIYTIRLKKGLRWDDGTEITAKDYVFSLLLQASPAMRGLGGALPNLSYLDGFEAYSTSEKEVFLGVHLVDEMTFSLHVRDEALPFFYENSYLLVNPAPMQVIAPESKVEDTEEGAKIEPALTKELLQKTLLDPTEGYVSKPVPGCGAYKLISFDREKGEAEFEKNEYYLGDHAGQKPQISSLKLVNVAGDKAIGALRGGEIDILHAVVDGNMIDRGRTIKDTEFSAYARRGYAFFAFDLENGPTASKAVRQAIAYLLDREKIAKVYTSGYGWPVHGDYGFGHWAAAEAAGVKKLIDLPSLNGDAFKDYDALPLEHYSPDFEKAVALLEEDGWTLNADGEEFRAGGSQIRHRKTDSGLEMLELRWLQIKDSRLSKLAQANLESACKRAGIKLSISEVSQNEFFESYYGREPVGYNLYLLASNFSAAYDPYQMLMSSTAKAFGMKEHDPELIKLAKALRETKQGDTAQYLKNFIEYQKYYNELLPTLPIYSNAYFDFYKKGIENYKPETHDSIASAILYVSR